MTELFDEVDEELRREQIKKLWDRYSIVIVAAAVLIVAGVGGWRGYQYWNSKQAAAAGSAFEAAVILADQQKHAEAETAFNKLAADAPSGYRALARLRAAAEVTQRDPQAAVKLYEAIGSDAAVALSQQEFAIIQAASLLLDTVPYEEIRKRLEPLAGAGRTYRHTARDLLAVAAWRANDALAARQWVELIMNDAETPGSIRTRAEALVALLPPSAKS